MALPILWVFTHLFYRRLLRPRSLTTSTDRPEAAMIGRDGPRGLDDLEHDLRRQLANDQLEAARHLAPRRATTLKMTPN